MVDVISTRLDRVASAVALQYSALTGPDQLALDVTNVKRHHPYTGAEQQGFTVDWESLRAVKFKGDESKRHLERLLVRAQLQFEAVLGRVLAAFWRRVLHALQGVRVASIRKLRRRDDTHDALNALSMGHVGGGVGMGAGATAVGVLLPPPRTAVAIWSIDEAEDLLRAASPPTAVRGGGGGSSSIIAGDSDAGEEGSDGHGGAAQKVARAWLEEGVHLRVDLHVYLRGAPVAPQDLADADRCGSAVVQWCGSAVVRWCGGAVVWW